MYLYTSKIIALICICWIAVFSSCNKPQPIDRMNWIEGNWKAKMGNAEFHESWIKNTDTSFVGEGFMVSKGDTVFSEKLKLEQKNGLVYYTPVIGDQVCQPAPFKLLSSNNGEFVFVYEIPDYPTRIKYHYFEPDSLCEEVQAKNDSGKLATVLYPMKRL